RARVSRRLRDDGDAVALAPDRELLARGGTERVPRGEQDLVAPGLEQLRELADRGGLARAVHAREHDDERLAPGSRERRLERREQLGEDRVQLGFELGGALQPALAAALAQAREQVLGGIDAGIGREQRGLELLEQRLVDPTAAEQPRQARARAREPI